jgi:hypothetical protein
MLWWPVMAKEDDEGGGQQRRRRRGGDYGGSKLRRVQFLRTFVVFPCKKTDKLLASC